MKVYDFENILSNLSLISSAWTIKIRTTRRAVIRIGIVLYPKNKNDIGIKMKERSPAIVKLLVSG